jgi:hypothetical protein
MTAGKYDITIEQGSDFSLTLTVKEGGSVKPLNGFTARGSMRKTYDDATAHDFTFTSDYDDDGIIIMKMAHTATDDLDAGSYVYDVELVHSGNNTVQRLIEGKAEVTREVTRG